MKLLIATKNKGKAAEFEKLLSPHGYEIKTLLDFPEIGEIVENGNTFESNALIKAKALYDATGIACIADDSGLCVDALDGAPGLLSARYAGEKATDDANIDLLLENMKDCEDRNAKFVCAICHYDGKDQEIFMGECHGKIGYERQGDNGFGYDPIFIYENGKTFAQMTSEEKNEISHRARAIKKTVWFLQALKTHNDTEKGE